MLDFIKDNEPRNMTMQNNDTDDNLASFIQRKERRKEFDYGLAMSNRISVVQRMYNSSDGEKTVSDYINEKKSSRNGSYGLPVQLKNGIESLSGYSMDNVRVHYNSDKPAKLNALAYTEGNDINIAHGQEKHLPHEAWHVVQQKQGRVKPTMRMNGVGINDDVDLEHEADVMGSKAAANGSFNARTLQFKSGSICVQRVMPAKNNFGNYTIVPDGDPISRGSTVTLTVPIQAYTKVDALRKISIEAARIGTLSKSMTGNEYFKAVISAIYLTESSWRALALDRNAKLNPVNLKLTYHFGGNPGGGAAWGPGYIVKVEKTKKSGGSRDANMVESLNVNNNTEYSNAHEDTNKNILAETYKKDNPEGRDGGIRSRNYDAYTKLAGEGARFKCVRDNMNKLKNNSVFYTGSYGIKFSDLWKMWKDVFYKGYSIENDEIKNCINDYLDLKAGNVQFGSLQKDGPNELATTIHGKKFNWYKDKDVKATSKNEQPSLIRNDNSKMYWKKKAYDLADKYIKNYGVNEETDVNLG